MKNKFQVSYFESIDNLNLTSFQIDFYEKYRVSGICFQFSVLHMFYIKKTEMNFSFPVVFLCQYCINFF